MRGLRKLVIGYSTCAVAVVLSFLGVQQLGVGQTSSLSIDSSNTYNTLASTHSYCDALSGSTDYVEYLQSASNSGDSRVLFAGCGGFF